MARLLKSIPNEWGPKFDGPSGAVTNTRTGPNQIKFVAPSHMALIMFTAQPGLQIALNGDRVTTGIAPVGSLEIIPAGYEFFARWRVETDNLLIAMNSKRLARLARLEFDTDTFELEPPKLGYVDDRALMLGQLIREEIRRAERANENCLDSLITLFGTYLLRNYSSTKSPIARLFKGGLTPCAWRKVNGYIQAHLSKKVSVSDLAQVAELSPSHFLRAFRHTTGQPPHQFLLTSRLGYARQLITTTDKPFTTIAKEAGFNSNSHMTATMRRVWGTTPTKLRK